MKNKGMTILEFIFCIIVIFIIVITAIPIVLKYARETGQKDTINEYKVEQYEKSLSGMNYSNGESWHKNCKVKIFYSNDESEINNFINNKDIVDIKTTAYRVLVIYTNSLKGNEYEKIN